MLEVVILPCVQILKEENSTEISSISANSAEHSSRPEAVAVTHTADEALHSWPYTRHVCRSAREIPKQHCVLETFTVPENNFSRKLPKIQIHNWERRKSAGKLSEI